MCLFMSFISNISGVLSRFVKSKCDQHTSLWSRRMFDSPGCPGTGRRQKICPRKRIHPHGINGSGLIVPAQVEEGLDSTLALLCTALLGDRKNPCSSVWCGGSRRVSWVAERERERPPDDRFSHAFISIKALAGKHPEIYIMYINIA